MVPRLASISSTVGRLGISSRIHLLNVFLVFPEVRRALINFVEHNIEHVQRVGHIILDGVVDPDTWASYKVASN